MADPVALADFAPGHNTRVVRVTPGDDVRTLLPHLEGISLIEIALPSFRDGRAYSSARILREAGYDGTLRAVGDVLVDQLVFLRRCGFDDFAPDQPLDPVAVQAALSRYDAVYQGAADGAAPVWRRRHG